MNKTEFHSHASKQECFNKIQNHRQMSRNRYRRCTLDDLVDACSDALYDMEGIAKGVSARTVQGDLQIMRSDKLVFRSVDITKEEALAERYEVSWSSLILVDYDKSGKESATNLTEFAFGNARTAPDKFKQGLSDRITEMLNN